MKRIVHIDYEQVVQLVENLTLVDHTFYASLGHYPGFAHLFHSIHLFRFFTHNSPNFAEATFSDTVIVYELFFGDRLEDIYNLLVMELVLTLYVFWEISRFEIFVKIAHMI